MPSGLRFSKAADNSRPYKCHRYDLFGPKIQRRLFLYGNNSLNAWIMLESDPLVQAYCERPIYVQDSKPKRVVDFWVKQAAGEQLWLLTNRPRQPEAEQEDVAFNAWAAANGFGLKWLDGSALAERDQFLKNWGTVLHYLEQNQPRLSPRLLGAVAEHVGPGETLGGLERGIAGEDPQLVRAAAFKLLHEGKLRCDTIGSHALGLGTRLEPA
jgi:hypothetical protein